MWPAVTIQLSAVTVWQAVATVLIDGAPSRDFVHNQKKALYEMLNFKVAAALFVIMWKHICVKLGRQFIFVGAVASHPPSWLPLLIFWVLCYVMCAAGRHALTTTMTHSVTNGFLRVLTAASFKHYKKSIE